MCLTGLLSADHIVTLQLPKEIAFDCVKIALFDTILYCDDSGSMRFEEGGDRINDLKVGFFAYFWLVHLRCTRADAAYCPCNR